LEAQSDAELRVIEAVEHAKAVLDAAGLQALARLRSCIESTELARTADLGARTPAGWLDADRLTMLEVTTATGLGPQEVHDRLNLATDHSVAAADLRARLRSGTVTLHRARLLHEQTRHLDADTAIEVTASVLRPKDGAPPSPTLFRQRLTRACLAADRDAALRRRRARRRRGAFARIDPDGLGVLTVTNDADKVIAAMERADALARAARQAGDLRTLDTLRADAITDLLTFATVPDTGTASGRPDTPSASGASGAFRGASPSSDGSGAAAHDDAWTALLGRRPAASVSLVVPLPVALGASDTPCEIPGYGWIDAQHARHLMLGPDTRWRLIGVDPTTGTAHAVSTTSYRPTPTIAALVEAVDGTCRGPGCTIPAARCDLDHDTPWPHGPTDTTNLTSKHRQHHNARTHGHWTATRDQDARVHWRTTAGRRYTTHPKDWLEDLRPAPPPPPKPAPRRYDDSPPPF
ncbi:HNH endonuclease signature motif containing protein, partial [Intrasporangium sp. YIM S08009]|uniref:HNH endonuclease signature motif containing protein n=1 Tax=Intrasporangium zincisolvens TaxID=3080018 RepID=UPI002B058025